MATSTVVIFDNEDGIHVIGGTDGIGVGNPGVVLDLMAEHAEAHHCRGPNPERDNNDLRYGRCREEVVNGVVTYVTAKLGDPGTIPMMSWAP